MAYITCFSGFVAKWECLLDIWTKRLDLDKWVCKTFRGTIRFHQESVSEQRNINSVAGFSFLFVTRGRCCGKTVQSSSPRRLHSLLITLACIPNCLPPACCFTWTHKWVNLHYIYFILIIYTIQLKLQNWGCILHFTHVAICSEHILPAEDRCLY